MSQLLRLNIDGNWTLDDFASTYEAIEQLYEFQAYCLWANEMGFHKSSSEHLHRMMDAEFLLRFPAPFWGDQDTTLESIADLTHRIRDVSRKQFPMHIPQRATVKRITYSSPGVTDIAGLGEIIGHIKDLIIKVTEMCLNRQHQKEVARQLKIENDKSELEMVGLRLTAIDQFIDVARKAGFTKKQIRTTIQSVDGKVDLIEGLVEQGKIKSIELIEESNEGKPQ